jgi:hypothetical protein
MLKIFQTAIFVVFCLGLPHALSAKTLSGYIDASTVAKISARFKQTMHDGGIQGVSAAIQKCYDDAPSGENAAAISECMLFDIAAYKFDRGMQVVFTARGLAPRAATPLLTERAFNARMQIYSGMAFGGSMQAMVRYFGNAPDKIIDDLNQ